MSSILFTQFELLFFFSNGRKISPSPACLQVGLEIISLSQDKAKTQMNDLRQRVFLTMYNFKIAKLSNRIIM